MKSDKPVIVLADDDKNTREGIGRALRDRYEVFLAENGERALELLSEHPVDVLISDMRMPGMDGLALLQRALARQPRPAVIVLTAYGSVETAVEAMKRGATDFLQKPVDLSVLEQRLERAVQMVRMERENETLKAQLDRRYELETMIGESSAMQEVFDIIRQAAPTTATVLIQGESGTGKELAARAIHQLSPRAKGPFIAVHCAALAPTLLESELFGHEKGAFTGATERRIGRFEMADGGTLFLDEVSEIDPAIQTKLLRVLEERRFERVGGRQTIEVDIRLVAATNRDLKALVEAGTFRRDLFFRLDVVTLTMPPLRKRKEDIPLLVQAMLREFSEKHGKPVRELTPEAMEILMRYDWPGNVRELRNTIERMVVLARDSRLTVRDIPAAIRSAVTAPSVAEGLATTSLIRPLGETEKQIILAALKKFGGNKTLTARELGISRRTLHRKLKTYETEGASLEGASGGSAL